ncbi:MAG TPA: ferritin-like domain-containing protein [Candidatus Acidoferrales bacterium]|nr:ferritin-like domain-containing protein [Candidatus Acidoferrales bacterium]
MAKESKPEPVDLVTRGLLDALEGGIPESPEISAVERLMNRFQAHEHEEEKIIQRYREIAKTSPNALIKFLLRMIIADEERHHSVTNLIIETLKGDLTWTKREPTVEALYELPEDRELLKITEDFIRLERDGIREYQSLMKASKGYYRGLFALLCKGIVRDSEKHVEMLEFLRDQLKGR